jgi:hypothetical protein
MARIGKIARARKSVNQAITGAIQAYSSLIKVFFQARRTQASLNWQAFAARAHRAQICFCRMVPFPCRPHLGPLPKGRGRIIRRLLEKTRACLCGTRRRIT